MAGRVALGSLINVHHGSINPLNLWGNFRFCSFSTARKVGNYVHKTFDTPVSSGNSNHFKAKDAKPTDSIMERLEAASPEQIASDPDLLNELGRQYQATRSDPDFIKGTKFCMQMMKSRLSGQ